MLPWLLVVIVLTGCVKEVSPPPVPPPPEDLSTWSIPDLIQPTIPMQTPLETRQPTEAERVYAYVPGTTYTVEVPIGWPLDVVLERGEQVRNIVGGDRTPQDAGQTPRWEVKSGVEGQGDAERAHLFLAATEPGLTLGVIVTTNRRAYYLTCRSVKKSPTRAMWWTYPSENRPQVPRTPHLLPDPHAPMRWHVGYILEGNAPQWQPRQVLDDGRKTYLVFPEITLFEAVPLVRLIGPNGPQIVNARQYLNVVILDQVIARAELRLGTGAQAEIVTIRRGNLRTIICPGETDCPKWPAAALPLQEHQP